MTLPLKSTFDHPVIQPTLILAQYKILRAIHDHQTDQNIFQRINQIRRIRSSALDQRDQGLNGFFRRRYSALDGLLEQDQLARQLRWDLAAPEGVNLTTFEKVRQCLIVSLCGKVASTIINA